MPIKEDKVAHIRRAVQAFGAHIINAPTLGQKERAQAYLNYVGAKDVFLMPPSTVVLFFDDRMKMESLQSGLEGTHRREHAAELFARIFDNPDVSLKLVYRPNPF